MIKVCDAVMGSGKTIAAINYMKSHRNGRFIYISPYLSELKRIKNECKGMRFYEPTGKFIKTKVTKVCHLEYLLSKGQNVVCTHQAFKSLTSDVVNYITKYDYTLIMDESIDLLVPLKYKSCDFEMLFELGVIKSKDRRFCIDPEYDGRFDESIIASFIKMCRFRDVTCIRRECHKQSNESVDSLWEYYFWEIPLDVIKAFKNIYILTYLFGSSILKQMLELEKMNYEYVYVTHSEEQGYGFGDINNAYFPPYLSKLSSLIKIENKKRFNNVGEDTYSCSQNWYNKSAHNVDMVRSKLLSYFTYYNKSADSNRKMWSCFRDTEKKLKYSGYASGFVPFNIRSSNDYRDRDILAYCVNIFMPTTERNFYRANGIKIEDGLEDEYALSIMLQWIWRSAIRDGKPIKIYIPSKRMRELLNDWICKMEHDYSVRNGKT